MEDTSASDMLNDMKNDKIFMKSLRNLLHRIEELTERFKEDEVTPEEVEEIKETPSEEPKDDRE